jgi:hypothetical protein
MRKQVMRKFSRAPEMFRAERPEWVRVRRPHRRNPVEALDNAEADSSAEGPDRAVAGKLDKAAAVDPVVARRAPLSGSSCRINLSSR